MVALATHRSAQPYEFTYDHVAGETGTQDDMFMRESASCPDRPACLDQNLRQQGLIAGAGCSAKSI